MGGNSPCVITIAPSAKPLMIPVLAAAVVVRVSAHRKKKNKDTPKSQENRLWRAQS
jgi:hypothetical protein